MIDTCITSISVSGYPRSTGGGAWDDPTIGNSSGPDVSIHILNPNGPDLISTFYVPNANGQELTFTGDYPFCKAGSYWDNEIGFFLYDLDDLDWSDVGSDDDFMTGFEFNLWDRVSLQGFPSSYSVSASNGTLTMTFTLSYQ